MKYALPATLFLLFLGLVATNAQDRSKAKPDWFDVPLSKKTMDFGPSFDKPSDTSPGWQWNAYRRARNTLTCYWFPTVMVKGSITLKYMRVEQADCDLRTDKASCWDHVRMQMDVKSAKEPVCLGYANTPVGELPSMVAHPVFVSLESPPVVESIDGPVLCWGPD